MEKTQFKWCNLIFEQSERGTWSVRYPGGIRCGCDTPEEARDHAIARHARELVYAQQQMVEYANEIASWNKVRGE